MLKKLIDIALEPSQSYAQWAMGFLCLLFTTNAVFAQEPLPEGFNTLQDYYLNDSSEVANLNRQAIALQQDTLLERAMDMATEAWALANKNEDEKGKAYTLVTLSSLYQQQEQEGEAISSLLEALNIFEQLNFTKGQAYLHLLIGDFYHDLQAHEKAAEYYANAHKAYRGIQLGEAENYCLEMAGELSTKAENHRKAIDHYEKLLDNYRAQGGQKAISRTLRNLVQSYINLRLFQIALRYNYELLETHRQLGDSVSVSDTYNNIGYCYTHLGDPQNALIYFQKAFALDQQIADNNRKDAYTLINIGIAYQNMGEYDQAVNSLMASLSIFRELEHDDAGSANLMNMIALVRLQKGEIYEAGNMVEAAIQLAEKANAPTILQKCYETYSRILQASNNYEQALEYYKRYLQIKDSLQLQEKVELERLLEKQNDIERQDKDLKLQLADEARKDLANRQLQLEAEASQQELELIRSEQAIQEFMLRQQALEKEKALQALVLARQRNEAQARQNQIDNLEKERQIRDLQLAEKERAAKERQLRIELLEQEKDYVEKDRNRARLVNALLLVISLLVVIGLIHTLHTKRSLSKSKKEIETKNEELSLKNEEISTQSERLMQANDEIAKQRDKAQQSFQELEATHRQLQSTQTKLVEAEKMASLGLLTAGIAHEINNPINFVSANISPLKRDLDDIAQFIAKARALNADNKLQEGLHELLAYGEHIEIDYLLQEINELLKGIEEGANRTKEIVMGLRNFSRLDEQDFKMADLHQGINSTLTVLGSKLKQKKILLVKEFGDLPKIDCLPGQLNQAFMNIIGNAIDAIDDAGKIHIKTWQDNELIKISIKDNGKGIPEAIKNKIFDPFFTTKDVGEGTGLGLSITYGIIERHEGTIEVISEDGKGTEFLITLPRKVRHVKPTLQQA